MSIFKELFILNVSVVNVRIVKSLRAMVSVGCVVKMIDEDVFSHIISFLASNDEYLIKHSLDVLIVAT